MLLQRLAQLMSRQKDEARLLDSKESRFAKIALSVGLLSFLAFLSVPMSQEVRQWFREDGKIRIESKRWNITYPEGEASTYTQDSPQLWQVKHADAARSYADWTRAHPGARIWVATRIQEEALQEALEKRANQLLLQLISGPFKVWVDGKLVAEGRSSQRGIPWLLPLPFERLAAGEPVPVVLQFEPTLDGLTEETSFHAALKGSLVTSAEGAGHIHRWLFEHETRYWVFASLNFLLFALFFSLWAASPKKPENFYMAAFALTQALIQVVHVQGMAAALGHARYTTFSQVLKTYDGVFMLFLGLAFARARRDLFKYALPALLVLPWILVAWLGPENEGLKTFRIFMHAACNALAAAATGLQAYALHARRVSGTYVPRRIRRLAAFSAAFAFMAAIGLSQALGDKLFTNGLFHRLAALGIGLFLGRIILVEYREQELLIEKTPVSRYHSRPVLPEKLGGAVLVADLKGSEMLFRLGAQQGDSGKLVQACLSHMWTAVLAHDGVVLQTEGDQILVFFDEASCASPIASALAATNQIAQNLELLRVRLREQLDGSVPADFTLDFRAGVTVGEIRPIWQEVAGSRYASWVEAGSSNPFVESARLMDLERKVKVDGHRTLVIVPEQLAERARSGTGWVAEQIVLDHQSEAGKHGKVYQFAVFAPSGRVRPAEPKREAA